MTPESKKAWTSLAIGLGWFFVILWPLLGIKPEGLEFARTFGVWARVTVAVVFIFILWRLKLAGRLDFVAKPAASARDSMAQRAGAVPTWVWLLILAAVAIVFPLITGRHAQSTAVDVLVYICLGLGLNIVIGLAGLLDLGYIAFYGVGAYKIGRASCRERVCHRV